MRPSEGIRRTAARQQRKVVRRLTAIIFSNVATEVSATSPPAQVPAVWTAPQSGPNFATAASYAFSTCSSLVTSATARSMPNTFAPSRSSRAETTVPRFPDAPVTTTQRPLSMSPPREIDSAGRCSQNAGSDARPRPSHTRLRRADRADVSLRGHVPLRQARADRDPRAAAGHDPFRRGLAAARDAPAAAETAGTAPSATEGAPQDRAARVRGGADQPRLLFIRTTTLDGRPRGAALHADPALRPAAGAGADRRVPRLADDVRRRSCA